MSDQDRPIAPAELLRALDLATAIEERDAAHREEMERLLLALADVLDSFDRLLAEAPAAAPETQPYLRSARLIARQLESAVREAGLVPIDGAGEAADPARHQVVEVRQGGGAGDEVVEVVRRGYEFRGRVLRAAQVIVASSSDEVTQ
jgi:molecular chaperone GrpE (heat shock protein)